MFLVPRSATGRMVLVVLATPALCIFWVQVLQHSMAWVYLSLACGAMGLAALARKSWAQALALTVMSLGIVLFVAELYLTSQNLSARAERTYNGQKKAFMDQPDALLGFAPVPEAMQVRTAKTLDGRVVYDVLHSTDAKGRRITPQNPDATKAVLFFGCSFTAGVGVNDQEVYPHAVATLLGPEYQVLNLGVGGYGPHQFLALLQSNRLDDIFAKYKDISVFFMSIATHERRAAGMVEWDTFGPRYVLENGRAVHKGNFADAAPLGPRFEGALLRSALFRDVLLERLQWRRNNMLELQKGIFLEAQRTLQQRHPGVSMTLLLMPDAAALAPDYRKAGLSVLDMTTALPGWPDPERYEIRDDRHPTPEAHARMAEGIAAFIRAQAGKKIPVQQ